MIDFCFVCNEKNSDMGECIDPPLVKVKWSVQIMQIFIHVCISFLFFFQKYYEWGYGYPINWQQSCPFTSHVFKTFDHFIQTSKQQNNK